MNIYLIIVLGFMCAMYIVSLVSESLNMRHCSPEIPDSFKDVYDKEKYKQSQNYLVETTRFGLFQESLSLIITIGFILWGGFNVIDLWVRQFSLGSISTGLLYFGSLSLLSMIVGIPFSIYFTFEIGRAHV